MQPLLIALQLLTRLPITLAGLPDSAAMGRSLLWYPVVGGLIGVVLLLVASVITSLPTTVAAFIILLVWVALTGALHLDGLADSADGWLGGFGDRERSLAIMQDPSCGPAGVVALVFVLLGKFVGLVALLEHGALGPALLITPFAARLLLVWLFLTTPYVREGGLGSRIAAALPRAAATLVAIGGSLLVIWLAGWLVLVGLGLMFWLLRRLLLVRLGGTTGDTAGAVVEIAEVTALLILVA